MKRPIPLARRRRSALWASALTVACGLTTVPATASAVDEQPPVFTRTPVAQAAADSCQVTLPDGLKATVGPDGARLTDPKAAAGQTMLAYRSNGDQYLVPQKALAKLATTDLADYDTTALAQRACGSDGFTPAAAQQAPAGDDSYTMGRLTAHMIGSNGKPALAGLLYLVNADHTTYADQVFSFVNGSLKLSVPTGHYEAIFYDITGHLTIDPEVTVGDGTSITLDGRTSTHQIPVPTTPRPATVTSTALTFYRSDGTPGGDAAGSVLQVSTLGSSGRVTVNTTDPVEHGRFTAVDTVNLNSPADAAEPYAYHVANSYDHLPSSYPTSVDESSLATVRRTYSAPAGQTGYDVLADNVAPAWDKTDGIITSFDVVTPGTVRTEYYSTPADLTWRTEVEDEQTADTLVGKGTVYRPGTQLSETWEGGVPHPGVEVDTGNNNVYCGACVSADTMAFAIGSDGDSTPGTLGLGFDETSTVNLSRNGELLATGTDGLFGAGVPVPAGRATYQLEERTVRNRAPLAPSTDTTWTFNADPGKDTNNTMPAQVQCAVPVDSCTALPLLFASTDTDADIQHQLTTGEHTVGLHVTRQQYAKAPAVSGARIQVSYDDGKTWQSLHLTGSNGDYQADYTVPADATGGTVSFKIAAWDGQGNRIDQVMPGAYGVR